MNPKHTSALTLLFFSAASAFGQITLNSVPSRSIGSPGLIITNINPNLVEGKELFAPQSVAVDNSTSPPAIYVSDTNNNRVLAWKDVNSFKSGATADIQIGQPDLFSTLPQGPIPQSSAGYTVYQSGLQLPTGIAVDPSTGDLYVADSGNNRVLRYRTPFNQVIQQHNQYPSPDLVIGQTSLTTRTLCTAALVSARTICLSTTNNTAQANIAFDGDHNLWITDPGYGRVLRFPIARIAGDNIYGPQADLVIGQPDFTTLQAALTNDATGFRRTTQFAIPSALSFDPSSGNLFVTDGNNGLINRVLVFTKPFSIGMSATRAMGVFPAAGTTQAVLDNALLSDPEAIFFPTGSATGVGVVDSAANRILLFPSYSAWPADGSAPQATYIMGQPNKLCPIAQPQSSSAACRAPNNGNAQPSDSTFNRPFGVAYTGTDLFVADSANNRVMDLQQQGSLFGPGVRFLGQQGPNTGSINFVEGKEFDFVLGATATATNNRYGDAAIAVDTSGSTPHLYVSDPANNRVLGFKDARDLKPGAIADIVLGQPDRYSTVTNYPSGDPFQPSDNNLFHPIGLVVDSNHDLYVADTGNGRVLRFQAPFDYQGTKLPQQANLVLGKPSFTSANLSDANKVNLYQPYGLAISGPGPANGLVVSDFGQNRVLYFEMTNSTFSAPADNGKAASIVFGQASFNSAASGNDLASMNRPHHVSCDAQGFVYVADTGNNRVMVFNNPAASGTPAFGEPAALTIPGLNAPYGVYVSTAGITMGEIWVADTGASANNLKRYRSYNDVQLSNTPINSLTDASSNTSPNFLIQPLAVTQDQYGDLFVADNSNRVIFYYPGLSPLNGASFLPLALAPGILATIKPCQNCSTAQFLFQESEQSAPPLPKAKLDIEVLFDGTAVPLYDVFPYQINFVVPMGARPTGLADLQVVQVSTGRILGAAQVPMAPVSPALQEVPLGQSGALHYVAARNLPDNSINGPTNPAPKGSVVSIYGTGQGFVHGAPADGDPITSAFFADNPVTVYINGIDVNSAGNGCDIGQPSTPCIQYSGLSSAPGQWQINLQIPKNVVPGGVAGTAAPAVILQVVVSGKVNTEQAPFKTVLAVK